jgi:hypothetical protein
VFADRSGELNYWEDFYDPQNIKMSLESFFNSLFKEHSIKEPEHF